MKSKYITPEITVVEFKVEAGFAESVEFSIGGSVGSGGAGGIGGEGGSPQSGDQAAAYGDGGDFSGYFN